MTSYRTIVADPPWPHGRTGLGFGRNGNNALWQPGEMRSTEVPYGTMPLADIAALPVAGFADSAGCHLYLWTTQAFLFDAARIANGWGFSLSSTLVWCKEPRGFNMGGTYASTTEFVLFCRRGTLKAKQRIQRQWFVWPRVVGSPVKYGEKRTTGHSAKPEAFLDMVESVSPGPYLEMFARRARFGWDYYGDESLGTVAA